MKPPLSAVAVRGVVSQPALALAEAAIGQMKIFPNNFTCALAASAYFGAFCGSREESHKVAMCTRQWKSSLACPSAALLRSSLFSWIDTCPGTGVSTGFQALLPFEKDFTRGRT